MAEQLCKSLAVKVPYADICYKLLDANIPSAEKSIEVHGWLDSAGSYDPMMEISLHGYGLWW